VLAALLLSVTVSVAAKGRVEPMLMADHTYQRTRRVWVYTPPGYDAAGGKSYNLIVFLDGDSYRDEIPAPEILDRLAAGGKIAPTVAVMVDTSRERLGDLANRSRFADFAAKELVPWIRAKWRVAHDPRRVTVAGFSAGGLGAAYLAYRHPELFGNVLSQSGAFWRGNEGTSEPGEWLTDQFRQAAPLPVRFYLEVGGEETSPVANGVVFIQAVRNFRDVLRAKGYAMRYAEVQGGRHEVAHWRAALAAGIEYLSQ